MAAHFLQAGAQTLRLSQSPLPKPRDGDSVTLNCVRMKIEYLISRCSNEAGVFLTRVKGTLDGTMQYEKSVTYRFLRFPQMTMNDVGHQNPQGRCQNWHRNWHRTEREKWGVSETEDRRTAWAATRTIHAAAPTRLHDLTLSSPALSLSR
jgi:hypothetical protein